jgi:hypothetical protein
MLGGTVNLQEVGPDGRSLGYWGCALKGDCGIASPQPHLCFSESWLETWALTWTCTAATVCHPSRGPNPWDHLILDLNLTNHKWK